MIAAEKRSNLQPPPEIKFNSKPATTRKFQKLPCSNLKPNTQANPKIKSVNFKPSRPSRKQSRDLKVKFAKKPRNIIFTTRKRNKRPSAKNLRRKDPKRCPDANSADQNADGKGRSDVEFLLFSDLLKFLFVMLFHALKGQI